MYIEYELARITGRLLLAFLPHWMPARRVVNSLCWAAGVCACVRVCVSAQRLDAGCAPPPAVSARACIACARPLSCER
jgi:hypothetical protein